PTTATGSPPSAGGAASASAGTKRFENPKGSKRERPKSARDETVPFNASSRKVRRSMSSKAKPSAALPWEARSDSTKSARRKLRFKLRKSRERPIPPTYQDGNR